MIITFQHFLLAVPHDMDVLDPNKLEFDVGVVVFVFIPFSCSSVCDRIQLEKKILSVFLSSCHSRIPTICNLRKRLVLQLIVAILDYSNIVYLKLISLLPLYYKGRIRL